MRRVRVIHKTPIAEFANVVHTYRDAVYRLWIISPWIGQYIDGSVDPLGLLIDALRTNKKYMLNVITRQPKASAHWHRDALAVLKTNAKPTLFFCNSLHTKLYIAETDGMIAAMMGSPNMTAGGNTANLELALELRVSSLSREDEVSATVSDLVEYARDLLQHESVEIAG